MTIAFVTLTLSEPTLKVTLLDPRYTVTPVRQRNSCPNGIVQSPSGRTHIENVAAVSGWLQTFDGTHIPEPLPMRIEPPERPVDALTPSCIAPREVASSAVATPPIVSSGQYAIGAG